jgi:TRAP-type C4-dicarboxylate transport system permease small subunit
MAVAAAFFLVFLMLVTFVDVLGRYAFNAPLVFAVEVIELGMGLVIGFGLAATTLSGGHISVDLVSAAAPKAVRALLMRLSALVGLIFFGLVAWRLWDRATNFLSDGLETQVLGLPVWPVVMVMAAATLVAALVAAHLLVARPDRGAGD